MKWLILLIPLFLLISCECGCEKARFAGNVVAKEKDARNYYIIFKDNKLNKLFKVNTDYPTYYNNVVGSVVNFTLDARAIAWDGVYTHEQASEFVRLKNGQETEKNIKNK